jgi:hypothetical protein
MANQLDSLGFNLSDESGYSEILRKILENGTVIETKRGKYVRWILGSGVELIASLDKSSKPISIKPYFFGNTIYKAKLTKSFKSMGVSGMDGSIMLWSEPLAETTERSFPFVAELPEFGVYDFSSVPLNVEVQVCAFGTELTVFKSEQEYMDFQKGRNKFEVKSFVPIGMFEDDGMYKTNPDPLGVITGIVGATEKLRNPLTDESFIWIKLETVGGEVDVVANEDTLKGTVEEGDILGGMFYISARVVGELPVVKADDAEL